jgi:hypothetical protein
MLHLIDGTIASLRSTDDVNHSPSQSTALDPERPIVVQPRPGSDTESLCILNVDNPTTDPWRIPILPSQFIQTWDCMSDSNQGLTVERLSSLVTYACASPSVSHQDSESHFTTSSPLDTAQKPKSAGNRSELNNLLSSSPPSSSSAALFSSQPLPSSQSTVLSEMADTCPASNNHVENVDDMALYSHASAPSDVPMQVIQGPLTPDVLPPESADNLLLTPAQPAESDYPCVTDTEVNTTLSLKTLVCSISFLLL